MTIQIEVTAEDIQNGEVCNKRHCPIAIAAQRVFRCPVQVLCDTLLVEQDNGPVLFYNLPTVAMKFIATVDNNGKPSARPKPFTFSIKSL